MSRRERARRFASRSPGTPQLDDAYSICRSQSRKRYRGLRTATLCRGGHKSESGAPGRPASSAGQAARDQGLVSGSFRQRSAPPPDWAATDKDRRCRGRWFAELTRKQIRRGVHTSTKQLETDIRAFIERHNENPKPYRWTKPADKILASVKRFCQRTQNTLHSEL